MESIHYTLLLGVKLELEEKVIETNPDWKGDFEDKNIPEYILSRISEDECLEWSDIVVKDEQYAYGEKEITRSCVFPNGEIAKNLIKNFTFATADCDLSRLCFLSDYNDYEEEQLFGLSLLSHNSDSTYYPAEEQKLVTAFNNKAKLAEMINKYGFNFKPEDMKLHQLME